jgi:hypothetical protein
MSITLEDETGIANLVEWPQVFEKFRRVVMCASMSAVDVTKVPDKAESIFQSVFLTFSQQTIEEVYRCSGFIAHLNGTISRPRKLNFDEAFADTLSFCIRGLVDFEASLLS